jgi:hypothetical protein
MWLKGAGGLGKTQWSQFMEAKFNWVYRSVGEGQYADILYAIKPYHRLILFDIGRSNFKDNWLNKTYFYSILENVKNGNFESTKYVPEKRVLNATPHVVVMANEWPVLDNLSLDRWLLWELVENEQPQ